jgi:hypothetical protein
VNDDLRPAEIISAPGLSEAEIAALRDDIERTYRGTASVGKIILSRPPATGFIRCDDNESPATEQP